MFRYILFIRWVETRNLKKPNFCVFPLNHRLCDSHSRWPKNRANSISTNPLGAIVAFSLRPWVLRAQSMSAGSLYWTLLRGPVCLGSGRTRNCGPTSPLTSRSGKPRVRVRWSCEMLLNFSCLAPTKALYAMMLFDRYRRVHQGSSTQLTEHTVKTRQF